MSKKIVIIGNTARSFLLFRTPLLRIFIENGWKVYCFANDFSKETSDKIVELGCIPVEYNSKRGGLNPLKDLVSLFQLKRKILAISPDVVFSYFVKPAIYGTIAAKKAKVGRIVCMLEGLGYFFTEQPNGMPFTTRCIRTVQAVLYRLSLPLANCVLFLNQDDVQDLVVRFGIPVKRYSVIGPIGLDLKLYPQWQIDLNHLSFFFIGRLLKEKGIFEFLEVAERVKRRFPFVLFYVIGEVDRDNPGALTSGELMRYVNDGIIIHPGHVQDVVGWIKKGSVFVLPSYREGFPRSTQEAMAMGRAVITTDAPGCRDSVIENVNGFIVKRWSSDELYDRVVDLVLHPDRIIEMGENSSKIAQEKFDGYKNNLKLYSLIVGDVS